MKPHLTIFAAGLMGLATACPAGPLNKAWVGKDAQWVVHIDVEAAVGSAVGRYVSAHREEFEPRGMKELRSELGMDPIQDVKGVTIYGTGFSGSDGVAVVHTTDAVERLAERLRERDKSFKQVSEGRLTLFSWSDHGFKHYATILPAAAANERLMVTAVSKERLLAGVAVLEARSAALAAAPEGQLARAPRPGSFIFAVSNAMPEVEAAPLRNTRAFAFELGESEGQLFAELMLVSNSTENAANLARIMQGGLALVRMGVGSDPESVELRELGALMDAIRIVSDDDRITASFSCSTDKTLAALKGLGEARRSLEAMDKSRPNTRTTGAAEPDARKDR